MANTIFNDIQVKIKSGNPITRLIIINVFVFLAISFVRIFVFLSGESGAAVSLEHFLLDNLSLPLSFSGMLYKPWTLITYMFTHFAFTHIFWNLITLYWFGQILSEYTSVKKIIPLYLLGGIAGAIITTLLVTIMPALHMYIGAPLIGASAGVTAIIVASATLVPEVRMNLIFIGPVKLLYVALIVIFIDVLNVASYNNIGGNIAHLGGALMGFLFIKQYKNGRDLAKPFNLFFDWLNRITSGNKTQMKVVHRKKLSDEDYNYNKIVTQKQVDAILDKISKSGYESLSKAEKDILFKASTKK
jgi:membrane associated rhomboid family serine protease